MSVITSLRAYLGRTVLGTPSPIVFDDRVADWREAEARSVGYNHEAILQQVLGATQSVVKGEAAFERDGITFTKPQYRWPIAYALMRAAQGRDSLRVLDIGGSLGSTYWQHRSVLPDLDISWTVVEQPAYVEAGRALGHDRLTFVDSLHEVHQGTAWDVALLSSVLQYLPQPWQLLQDVMGCGVRSIVIDRTPFYQGAMDVATIQHVPSHIYEASYPAWILSHDQLAAVLAPWRTVAEFPGIEPDMKTRSGLPFSWRGYLAERPES